MTDHLLISELSLNSGEVQNFVGIHPTRDESEGEEPRSAVQEKDSMLREFSHFHPDILKIIRFAAFD